MNAFELTNLVLFTQWDLIHVTFIVYFSFIYCFVMEILIQTFLFKFWCTITYRLLEGSDEQAVPTTRPFSCSNL